MAKEVATVNKVKTTADLRAILFDCIEKVKAGTMDTTSAKQIAALSMSIVKTAELEVQFALAQNSLDGKDHGINIGPLTLTNQVQKM